MSGFSSNVHGQHIGNFADARSVSSEAGINLDANANAPITLAVERAVLQALRTGTNPSSNHAGGATSRATIERARDSIAALCDGLLEDGVVFTSGCTEANNCIIASAMATGAAIITSVVEHPSILEPVRHVQAQGGRVVYLDVDADGCVDLVGLEKALGSLRGPIILTIQSANSETGVIQPIELISNLVSKRNDVLFHTDGAQSFGKLRTAVNSGSGPHVISVSGHKLHGPMGVRQLLTLSVNILLGDSKNANKPLLNCAEAKKRAERSEYRFTNPYNNAVGGNLRPERRRANRVFSVFEVLGVGLETNNLIDSVLVHGKPKDIHNQLFDTELVYGKQIFDPLHQEYLGGGGKPEAVRNFRTGLEAQRRRAFFRLQESENIESTSPWRLTIFHHGGQYLQLLDALEDGRRRELVDRYTRQLVRGLNRALTGMMAMEDNKLWLAGTIGKTDDPAGRVSTTEGIERSSFQGLSLKLKLDPIKRRPAFQVLPPPYMKEAKMPELDLRPLLFEYLMRVAGGSLPASFSRQCHQEIRHYALVATASITRLLQQPEDDGLHVVHMLSLGNQGEVQPHRIEI